MKNEKTECVVLGTAIPIQDKCIILTESQVLIALKYFIPNFSKKLLFY
ncbi:hypothetical protein [uncultured Draconibacterium sp.]|nr:hypothetical protein [uncultured Draconibacterium sp.]